VAGQGGTLAKFTLIILESGALVSYCKWTFISMCRQGGHKPMNIGMRVAFSIGDKHFVMLAH
jgi:hypothetical protein